MITVLHIPARLDVPVACDMTTAQDTPEQRLAEYRRLFERALVRRERRNDGVVLRFRGEVRETVEDLARREAVCCPFLDYRVEIDGEDVVWTLSGDDRAGAILEAFHGRGPGA